MPSPEYTQELIHKCPRDGEGVTPCCGLSPFELPRTDRLTLDDRKVTCKKAEDKNGR